ncbi:hypothetical protein ACFVWX_19470 [Streptomyces sp. NPDC058220]|uniref:hypothetical protein n=1 Tax=unclassified Streptomyces TaxID=2593676 RepID=UPI0036579157
MMPSYLWPDLLSAMLLLAVSAHSGRPPAQRSVINRQARSAVVRLKRLIRGVPFLLVLALVACSKGGGATNAKAVRELATDKNAVAARKRRHGMVFQLKLSSPVCYRVAK